MNCISPPISQTTEQSGIAHSVKGSVPGSNTNTQLRVANGVVRNQSRNKAQKEWLPCGQIRNNKANRMYATQRKL